MELTFVHYYAAHVCHVPNQWWLFPVFRVCYSLNTRKILAHFSHFEQFFASFFFANFFVRTILLLNFAQLSVKGMLVRTLCGSWKKETTSAGKISHFERSSQKTRWFKQTSGSKWEKLARIFLVVTMPCTCQWTDLDSTVIWLMGMLGLHLHVQIVLWIQLAGNRLSHIKVMALDMHFWSHLSAWLFISSVSV